MSRSNLYIVLSIHVLYYLLEFTMTMYAASLSFFFCNTSNWTISDFEIRSQNIGVCIHTHYKEVLKCQNGEIVTRSCDRAAFYDEQQFWRFEGFMFLASIVSTICVVTRRKVLNKRMLQRVQRQLANCV